MFSPVFALVYMTICAYNDIVLRGTRKRDHGGGPAGAGEHLDN